MIHSIARILALAGAAGSVASLGYYLLCLWSAAAFLRRRGMADEAARPAVPLPPVSILKPLKGVDPEMYENFRSHCVQDYGEYEIIFGVSDRNDPAITEVERLQKDFPQRPIQLVVCEENLGVNTKVSALAQMLRRARYDHLVVNDSDIRVTPGYLRSVIAPLVAGDRAISESSTRSGRVGLVTCLYRGVPSPTLGSRLESLGISTDFCAGVLAAQQLEGGIRFGLGSTLAFRRADLQAAGGFEAFADYLADDYQLGHQLTAHGLQGKLSETVVETFLPPYTLREFMRHQLRWARTLRASRPAGYAGLVLTFGLCWALLALLSSSAAPWAWGLLAAVAVARVAVAVAVGRFVLQDRRMLPLLILLPLRDVIALFIWAASFAGSKVQWRGDAFVLRNGKLAKL